MSVPVTKWVLRELSGTLQELLGPQSLGRRGLFRNEYVAGLRAGQNEPSEVRRRRIGERLWALAMLEAWLRVFIDGRGRRPA
jgi:asparagine synthase (glutamine-hydrolysing)